MQVTIIFLEKWRKTKLYKFFKLFYDSKGKYFDQNNFQPEFENEKLKTIN